MSGGHRGMAAAAAEQAEWQLSGHVRRLFRRVTAATRVAKSMSTLNRLVVMQQACLAIESKGYVVIFNEILVCEYNTKCNVAPPGVRKLNKQTLDFGYVVTGN